MEHDTQPPFQPKIALQEFFDSFDVPRFRDELDEDTRNKYYALGMNLIAEEHGEVYDAWKDGSLPHLAKELADLVYVCFWMAEYLGLDLEKVVDLVHASNMSKISPTGDIQRAPDGKVLKGRWYREPELSPENILQDPANFSFHILQLPLF